MGTQSHKQVTYYAVGYAKTGCQVQGIPGALKKSTWLGMGMLGKLPGRGDAGTELAK